MIKFCAPSIISINMAGSPELVTREAEPLPMRYAIGIAGQGGTSIGEFFLHEYERSSAFREVFDTAGSVLSSTIPGFSIQRLCFEETPENQKQVEQTLFSHLANTTIYVAKYKAFREEFPNSNDAEFILPQSAGECAALAISGMVPFETALLVAKKRGELTERAAQQNPGKMVYVKGLSGGYERLAQVCSQVSEEMQGVVAVSNKNSPSVQIFSGQNELVEEVKRRIDRKVIDLPISFGSHCALMNPMLEEWGEFLRSISMDRPRMKWILNGTTTQDPERIVDRMTVGPTQLVDWESSVQELDRQGIGTMAEMTPNVQRRIVVGRFTQDTIPEFKIIAR